MHQHQLVLASLSPRRKELLGYLGIPFTIHSMNIEEVSDKEEPSDFVQDLAFQKGQAVHRDLAKREDYLKTFFPYIIAADTMVSIGKKVLGRPQDENHAREMLQELSGTIHQAYTGVYLGWWNQTKKEWCEKIFFEKTDVEFAVISPELLENYLKTGDALDKAGSYGIQGPAQVFVKGLNGSFSNVMGFPLERFWREYQQTLAQ